MGPPHEGNIVVLFYANGLAPVYAQIVFSGELLPGGGAFGGDLDTAIPQIPSVTNGPPVSIINVKLDDRPRTISPTTSVSTANRSAIKPQGISLPTKCPQRRLPVLRAVHVPRRQPGHRNAQRALPAAGAPPQIVSAGFLGAELPLSPEDGPGLPCRGLPRPRCSASPAWVSLSEPQSRPCLGLACELTVSAPLRTARHACRAGRAERSGACSSV